MPPKIEPLTAARNAWIAEQHRRAEDFVRRYADAAEVTIETLEMAWERWIAAGETDSDAIDGVIKAVGIGFGNALTTVTPLRWVLATDNDTSELALSAFAGRGDLLIVPANIVAKRFERRETKFLSAVYSAIVTQVGMIEKSQRPAGSRELPLWKRLVLGRRSD